MMPHSVVVGYQYYRGPCCLHHLGEEQGPLEHWYPTATLHGITTQKTSTFTFRILDRRWDNK